MENPNHERLQEVYRADNPVQAQMLVDALDEVGIEAIVHGALLHGVMGDIPMGWPSAPKVMVLESNAVDARRVIDALTTVDAE